MNPIDEISPLDVPFLQWIDLVSEMVAEEEPELWALCQPKRIMPPQGFTNPKALAVAMWGHIRMWRHNEMHTDPHFMVVSSSLAMLHRQAPVYFVEKEFATAVARTRLPEGFRFQDLRWPLESLALCLHQDFCKAYFGYQVPFIALNRIMDGTYPDDFKRPELHRLLSGGRRLITPNNRIVIVGQAFTEQKSSPTEYAACYPLDTEVGIIREAPFMDSVPFEHAYFNGEFKPSTMTPDADKDLLNKIVLFATKLLLVITAAPKTVKSGELARPARAKHGKTRSALWHPNLIGAGYRLSRQSAPGAGTHASPDMHWRWGHFTHQVFGNRDQANFVSTSQLPRNPDGTIAWSQVEPGVRERFWANHELRWIQPVLVNPPEARKKKEELTHAAP